MELLGTQLGALIIPPPLLAVADDVIEQAFRSAVIESGQCPFRVIFD